MFGIYGLELCGERKGAAETAFIWWINIHQPDLLTESGRKFVADHLPVDNLVHLRTLSKQDFLKAFQVAKAAIAR
jgi:hypothetical protein